MLSIDSVLNLATHAISNRKGTTGGGLNDQGGSCQRGGRAEDPSYEVVSMSWSGLAMKSLGVMFHWGVGSQGAEGEF